MPKLLSAVGMEGIDIAVRRGEDGEIIGDGWGGIDGVFAFEFSLSGIGLKSSEGMLGHLKSAANFFNGHVWT